MNKLKYISLNKLINLIKVIVSYQLSSLFKKLIIWGYPFSLTTEPTNKCNLQCLECPTGNKSSSVEKGEMSFHTYKNIIDQVNKHVIFQMIYFQGEPFLNKNIFDMINYSDKNKIYTRISTNGHFLNEENCIKTIQSGLKEIIISLDGFTQESYEKYRVGGKLETVIAGIKKLTSAKKELKSKYPKVILQFLVFSHNESEMSKIKTLCKSLHADKLEFKSAQITDPKNINLIPNQKKYSRYSKNNSKPQIKSTLKNKCFRIWTNMIINWQGHIIPCCFDKNSTYALGDTNIQNPLSLWRSKLFNEFRSKILENRAQIQMCCNCTEGLKK